MWTAKIRNHAFERIGERYAHHIDGDHFLGRSAFAYPWKEENLPRANIVRDGDLFTLKVAVPGYTKEELEILLEGDVLKIRGEKNVPGKEPNQEFILEEFDFDAFERCFKLSPKITQEKIEATCENGILTLVFKNIPLEQKKTHTRVLIS